MELKGFLHQDRFPVVIKTTEPFTTVCTAFKGINKIEEKMNLVVNWIKENSYNMYYPPMCLYFDDPSEVGYDNCRIEIRIPICEAAEEKEDEIGIKKVPPLKVLSTIYQGPYQGVGSAYGVLFNIMKQEGFDWSIGASIEVYWGDCCNTPPEKIITEVLIPIK